MNIRDIITEILSMPNTLKINFKYFKLSDAIKLPIKVNKNVILKNLKGNVMIDGKITRSMIKIGYGNVDIFDKNRSKSILKINGDVIFKGSAVIGHGVKINVNSGGTLILGDNFGISAESKIICNKKISFGSGCLVSWDCLIMDTDFHKIYSHQGKVDNLDNQIIIGDNVWICCGSTILKGVQIGSNNVVAANSNVVKSFPNKNCVIGGNPAMLIKDEVIWEM